MNKWTWNFILKMNENEINFFKWIISPKLILIKINFVKMNHVFIFFIHFQTLIKHIKKIQYVTIKMFKILKTASYKVSPLEFLHYFLISFASVHIHQNIMKKKIFSSCILSISYNNNNHNIFPSVSHFFMYRTEWKVLHTWHSSWQ